jgi:hypothetical protein
VGVKRQARGFSAGKVVEKTGKRGCKRQSRGVLKNAGTDVKKDRQVCARSMDKGTVQLDPEKTAQGVKTGRR